MKINFEPNPEIALPQTQFNPDIHRTQYKYNYIQIFKDIAAVTGKQERIKFEKSMYRQLVLNDLWFIVTFIFKIPGANRPFVVDACKEVENGPDGWTMDLWARKHYKSSIITKARTLQRILKYPEKSTMIASHTRPIAKKFLRPIMYVLESDETLKTSFPDILYADPRQESNKWSEDDGIIVRGHNNARSEANVEAWGIKEGMPISVHFDWILLDDLETRDDIKNPNTVLKVRESVDLCTDLLTEDGSISVIGTPYSHEGVYIPFCRDKKNADGTPTFLYRKKPATDNGFRTGNPVLLSKINLENEFSRKGIYEANCQQLIDPTPLNSRKLEPKFLQFIDHEKIPATIHKFMSIDSAGNMFNKSTREDAWAILVIGVEPKRDELGASNIYIVDALISPLTETEAIEEIVRMYLRNGIIMQVGVEKESLSTTEIHVQNALKVYGRNLSIERETLKILRPANRNKIERIMKALVWPLFNSKIFPPISGWQGIAKFLIALSSCLTSTISSSNSSIFSLIFRATSRMCPPFWAKKPICTFRA